jgi:streptogramin lyase
MQTLRGAGLVWIGILAAMLLAPMTAQVASAADAALSGAVRSSDGKVLEGAAVSARADGSTFTTTVYSSHGGEYRFPPLPPGHYQVRAQTVGYQEKEVASDITADKEAQVSFSLTPLADFSAQLSGSQWLASLPDQTPEDRRMKTVLANNCADCHSANFVLQNRFDQAGWSKVLDLMTKITYWAEISPGAEGDELAGRGAVIGAYKDELAAYLARVRGPNSAMKFQPPPKLTGESLQVVVTEYDIPVGGEKGSEYIPSRHTGAIWSEGTPSAYEGRAIHDVVVDPQGNVWFGDDGVRETSKRTLTKLDPRTGRITGYRLELANGTPMWNNGGTGIAMDPKGNYVWFVGRATGGTQFKSTDGGGTKGRNIRFDRETHQMQVFTPPDPNPGFFGTSSIFDSEGRLWGWRGGSGGLVRLDTKTDKYDEFVLGDRPYGITIDAKDNAWFTILETDQVGFIDKKTGIISLISLPPRDIDYATPKDRQIAMRLRDGAPIWHKGPRKMAADKNGDKVWFALYFGNGLGSVDINTKEVKEYPLPHPDYTPYSVDVDKNHMVWILCQNADRVLKFNPFTKQFTEYQLPTLGTGPRDIYVDNSTDPPTIWQPYWRLSRVARLQFRPEAAASKTK